MPYSPRGLRIASVRLLDCPPEGRRIHTSIIAELTDKANTAQSKHARHLDARPLDVGRPGAMQDARGQGCKTPERKNGLGMADTTGPQLAEGGPKRQGRDARVPFRRNVSLLRVSRAGWFF